jgi:hypothetical protein
VLSRSKLQDRSKKDAWLISLILNETQFADNSCVTALLDHGPPPVNIIVHMTLYLEVACAAVERPLAEDQIGSPVAMSTLDRASWLASRKRFLRVLMLASLRQARGKWRLCQPKIAA